MPSPIAPYTSYTPYVPYTAHTTLAGLDSTRLDFSGQGVAGKHLQSPSQIMVRAAPGGAGAWPGGTLHWNPKLKKKLVPWSQCPHVAGCISTAREPLNLSNAPHPKPTLNFN